MSGFYEAIGKIPIQVQSRYGYALDPVFEGMFLASALLVENGVASMMVRMVYTMREMMAGWKKPDRLLKTLGSEVLK